VTEPTKTASAHIRAKSNDRREPLQRSQVLGVRLRRAKARDPLCIKETQKGDGSAFLRVEDLIVMSRDSFVWSGASSVNNEDPNVIL
jgi:hypothetical protein